MKMKEDTSNTQDENCPEWLPEEGKQVWREILSDLIEAPWWDPVADRRY